MKIVINKCFGGFSLSPLAIKRMEELKGKPCYFFKQDISNGKFSDYEEISLKEATTAFMFHAFSIKNPNETLKSKDWHKMTDKEKKKHNELWDSICLDSRPSKRNDPLLIKVIEELGEKANGKCAKLKIVKIPNGVKWEIDEYDGLETIHEVHKSWG